MKPFAFLRSLSRTSKEPDPFTRDVVTYYGALAEVAREMSEKDWDCWEENERLEALNHDLSRRTAQADARLEVK